jgi:hypothetical protein
VVKVAAAGVLVPIAEGEAQDAPQVKLPLAAMAVANAPAAQSEGSDASAVAVEALPERAAVIVPAAKFPLPSLVTMALAVLVLAAVVAALGMDEQVKSPLAAMELANWLDAQSAGLAAKADAVEAFPVTAPVRGPEKPEAVIVAALKFA